MTIRVTAFAVLAALGGAGVATGTGGTATTYTGAFDGGGQISLRLSAEREEVGHISVDGITAECRVGSATLNYDISGSTPVMEDRSFAVRSQDGKAKALVKGRFTADWVTAKGAARVHGKIFPGKPRCDSEKQKFKAR